MNRDDLKELIELLEIGLVYSSHESAGHDERFKVAIDKVKFEIITANDGGLINEKNNTISF
jgi:hypothetical protein